MDQNPQNNGAQPPVPSPVPPLQPQQQQPLAPVQPPVQPTQPMEPMQPMTAVSPPKKSSKGKFVIGAAIAVVLLGGGLVAAQSFISSPTKVWERAVGNTKKGLDTFIELSKQPSDGMKIDGSVSVSAPLAIDGSISGHFYKGSGVMTMDAGAAGFRIDGEIRAMDVEASDNPDVYVKLNGLESVASLLGFAAGGISAPTNELDSLTNAVTEINDQWYVVDHTLIDQALATATSGSEVPELTDEDIDQISTQLMQVVDDYLFATDSEFAVVAVLEEYGKEDFEGVSTQKYKAGLNKENLKKMIVSLRDAVKDTKLAELLVDGTDQSYEEITSLDDLFMSIDEQDFSKATADIWVEASGKYVRNIRIYPLEDKKDSNYLDFAIPFEGGDTVPLVIRATIDDEGTKGEVTLGVDINSQTADTRFWSDVNVDSGGGQRFEMVGELKVSRTDEPVDVQKPEGAKNIYDLLPILTGDPTSPVLQPLPDGFGDFDSTVDFPLPIDDVEL